jgi:hypothetical protein
MTTVPVATLLVYGLIVIGGAVSRFPHSRQKWQFLLVSGLFFCSGMPAQSPKDM